MKENIFIAAKDFIELDPRKNRLYQQVTTDSMYKRCMVHMPPELIKSKTVLDLGCALGAGGYFALTNECSWYTGVDINIYSVETAKTLLSKYTTNKNFTVILQDVEQFLDDAINQGKTWDYIVASGVLYSFIDIVSILKKLSKVTREYILIDSQNWIEKVNTSSADYGIIAIYSQQPMNNSLDSENTNVTRGVAARISPRALDIVMSTLGFKSSGIILGEPIVDAFDPYRTKATLDNEERGTWRYIIRYERLDNEKHKSTLQEKLIKSNLNKNRISLNDSI